MPTWLIVGASRGIGFEFVKQLIARGDQVIATVRDPTKAADLWSLIGSSPLGACRLLLCDVASERLINTFVNELSDFRNRGLHRIDYVVLNAGILHYPNRATEVTFEDFEEHLKTNCIGPILTAQKLLQTGIPIGTIAFMSSDSASAQKFLSYEDGFAAYSASKAALNQALRHMAAELSRAACKTTILAMHPGEVSTDMQDIDIAWEIEGLLSPAQSISGMLSVIQEKGIADTGTFWTWDGKQYPW